MNKHSLSAEARRKTILSIVLGVICVIYVLPVLTVVINSFKLNTYVKTDTFALPNAESFAGWANFIKGLTFGNYPFLKSAGYSLFITIVSTALILLCTSLAAWDIGYAVFDSSVYAKFAADESWYAARYDVWYENAACHVYKIK